MGKLSKIPVKFHKNFAENPIKITDSGVCRNGRWWIKILVTLYQLMIKLVKSKIYKLRKSTKKWGTKMRTPLGVIDDGINIYIVFFTSYNYSEEFSEIGMVKLKLLAK